MRTNNESGITGGIREEARGKYQKSFQKHTIDMTCAWVDRILKEKGDTGEDGRIPAISEVNPEQLETMSELSPETPVPADGKKCIEGILNATTQKQMPDDMHGGRQKEIFLATTVLKAMADTRKDCAKCGIGFCTGNTNPKKEGKRGIMPSLVS